MGRGAILSILGYLITVAVCQDPFEGFGIDPSGYTGGSGSYPTGGNQQGAGYGGDGMGLPMPTEPEIAPYLPAPCNDLHENCVQWHARNYCKSSSSYYEFMQKNCRRTCGFCTPMPPPPPGPPTPPPRTGGPNCAYAVCAQLRCGYDEVLSQGEFDCCPKCVKRPSKGCTPVYKTTNLLGISHQGMKCDSLSPVVGSACFGVCGSASVQLLSGSEYQSCQCCKSQKVKKATTVLQCQRPGRYDLEQVLYEYDVILDCGCQKTECAAPYAAGMQMSGMSAQRMDGGAAGGAAQPDTAEMKEFSDMLSNVDQFNM